MNINKKIKKIKAVSMQLYLNNQIPSHLMQRIRNLNGNEDKPYIECLIELSEKFMRVKGYYKKHPLDIKIANGVIDSVIKDSFGDKIPIREERSS